jgi:hypothetical protein
MNLSRRGFLKLLAAIPGAAIASKVEILAPVVPVLHDPRFTEEEKENYWEGREEFELRFADFSVGVHSLSTRHEPVEAQFSWVTNENVASMYCRNLELSFSSYCGKTFPKTHEFFRSWIEPAFDGMSTKPRRAELIQHGRQESLKIADFDVLFPKTMQVNILGDLMVFDSTLAIENVRVYKENLEKCQSTMA